MPLDMSVVQYFTWEGKGGGGMGMGGGCYL
jgi:hypothetical protein